MENYQHQLKEHQARITKASKQSQEATAKATAQQQVSTTVVYASHAFILLLLEVFYSSSMHFRM